MVKDCQCVFKCVLMKDLLDSMCAKTEIYNTALFREHSQTSEDSIGIGQRPSLGSDTSPSETEDWTFSVPKSP